MSGLAASNAVFQEDRLLQQHQAALTLMQVMLDDPEVTSFSWLDLACGKGQILAHIDKTLNQQQRSKIKFYGYDLNNDYASITEELAEKNGFSSTNVEVGDIYRFSDIFNNGVKFDFITLTNTTHEVNPHRLASVVFDCLDRLSPRGCLFAYDMEILPENELGAIPWKKEEFERIIHEMLKSIGVENYRPGAGRFPHRTCTAWGIQVKKDILLREIKEPIATDKRDNALGQVGKAIQQIMANRAEECQRELDVLTKYGCQTEEEKNGEIRSLYEFWALQRAIRLAP